MHASLVLFRISTGQQRALRHDLAWRSPARFCHTIARMKHTTCLKLSVALAIAALTAQMHAAQALKPASATSARSATSCDRRYLLQVLTEYTEALTDNNTSRLAVSSNVRVTSNGMVTALGKGEMWGPGRKLPYRQAFVDPASGAAVSYGIVNNAGKYAFYIVRFKVEVKKITEIEEVS